jgi:hypothetical protein
MGGFELSLNSVVSLIEDHDGFIGWYKINRDYAKRSSDRNKFKNLLHSNSQVFRHLKGYILLRPNYEEVVNKGPRIPDYNSIRDLLIERLLVEDVPKIQKKTINNMFPFSETSVIVNDLVKKGLVNMNALYVYFTRSGREEFTKVADKMY